MKLYAHMMYTYIIILKVRNEDTQNLKSYGLIMECNGKHTLSEKRKLTIEIKFTRIERTSRRSLN